MPTAKEELSDLKALVSTLQTKMETLVESNKELSSRLQVVEITAPPALRALSQEGVRRAVEEDPDVRFEVLNNWRGQLQAGAIVRADHLPHLLDYVGAGLQLGAPRDHDSHLAQVRAEHDARVANAHAHAKEAQAAAARAQSISAQMNAESQQDAAKKREH